MTTNLPCHIVRDLLPTYVDGLTSPDTAAAIEDHTASCQACRALLDQMRAPAPVEPAPEDTPQVDYLKKVRRDSNRRSFRNAVIWGVVLAAVILANLWRLVPRDLDDIVPLDEVTSIDAHLTVTENGGFVFYDMKDLTPTDQTEKFDISYTLIMKTLREMKVRPSYLNFLPDIPSVSSGKYYDGTSLHLSVHSPNDNMNRGFFLDFLDGQTLSVADPFGDSRKVYYVTDPTWLDTIADYMAEYGVPST